MKTRHLGALAAFFIVTSASVFACSDFDASEAISDPDGGPDAGSAPDGALPERDAAGDDADLDASEDVATDASDGGDNPCLGVADNATVVGAKAPFNRCCNEKLVSFKDKDTCGGCSIHCDGDNTCVESSGKDGYYVCTCDEPSPADSRCFNAGYVSTSTGDALATGCFNGFCECNCKDNAATCKGGCPDNGICHEVSGGKANYCTYDEK